MSSVKKIVQQLRRLGKPYEYFALWILSYVVISIIVFIGLYLFRRWLVSTGTSTDDFIISLLDNLCAGIFTAICGVIFIYLVSPRISFDENLSVLDAWNINQALKKPLGITKAYFHRGRTGRWARTDVMPALYYAACKEGIQREIHLFLPDPRCRENLEAYAHYRNSLKHEVDDVWIWQRVRNEIVATILVASQLSARSIFFKSNVVLLEDFSIFRADLTDEALILTREDKRMPGWISTRSSLFYASYLEELHMASERGRKLDLRSMIISEKFETSSVRPSLKSLGIEMDLSEVDCEEIVKAIKETKSTYA